jgi:hypothetical protein
MDPARAMAEQSVGALWREGHRCGLIDATPMRPGRGRRASHPKRRRREGRGGWERFEEAVRSIEGGLRSGALSPGAARQRAHEAGLGEFIRVAESREEAVEAFAHFYGLGYYLWDAGGEPDDSGADLLRVSFATRKELT